MKRHLLIAAGAVFSACILIALVFLVVENSSTSPSQSDPHQATTALLTSTLSSSNRGVQRLTSVQWDDVGKVLTVEWTINDNLTDDFRKRGAMMDLEKILQAITTRGVPYAYQSVALNGTYSYADLYGNVTEKQVVSVLYSRATLSKVNWDGFITDNIYALADQATVHPDFVP